MLNHGHSIFRGHFKKTSQQDSFPSSLKALISMIVHGTNLKDLGKEESQVSLTISQLLRFNIMKASTKTTQLCDRSKREPPLPGYVSVLIYREMRSKKLITLLHTLECLSVISGFWSFRNKLQLLCVTRVSI